jgi:hypothetical protein
LALRRLFLVLIPIEKEAIVIRQGRRDYVNLCHFRCHHHNGGRKGMGKRIMWVRAYMGARIRNSFLSLCRKSERRWMIYEKGCYFHLMLLKSIVLKGGDHNLGRASYLLA